MINCILIDDDPAVTTCLRGYIAQFPFLKLIAVHHDPLQGLHAPGTANAQLIFMDIGMPGITGIDLTRLLNEKFGKRAPRVIFITGLEQHALEGYRVDALDYLIKPVSLEQFGSSVLKAMTYYERLSDADAYRPDGHIFLRVEQELIKVYLKDIAYIESDRDHVKVYLAIDGQQLTALSTLTHMADLLPAGAFMRIHRSFIIAVDKITAIQRQTIRIGRKIIPVGEQYKTQFKDLTNKWG